MKLPSYIHRERIKRRRGKRLGKTHWTEICQLVFSGLSIVGVVFIILQMGQVERAIKGETYSKIYDQEFTLFQNLLNDTTYYNYLYEKKQTFPGTPEHKKVTILIALFADYFEHICLQTENLDNEVKEAWTRWMFSMYESTPMLREHFDNYGNNYSPQCQNMIREFKRKIQLVNKK